MKNPYFLKFLNVSAFLDGDESEKKILSSVLAFSALFWTRDKAEKQAFLNLCLLDGEESEKIFFERVLFLPFWKGEESENIIFMNFGSFLPF